MSVVGFKQIPTGEQRESRQMKSFPENNEIDVNGEHVGNPPLQPVGIERGKGNGVKELVVDLMHPFVEERKMQTTMTPVENEIPNEHHRQEMEDVFFSFEPTKKGNYRMKSLCWWFCRMSLRRWVPGGRS